MPEPSILDIAVQTFAAPANPPRSKLFEKELKEVFSSTNRGFRILPNGIKEVGRFSAGNPKRLESGYRINENQNIDFIDPDFPAYYYDFPASESIFGILEVEGRLVILEGRYENDRFNYSTSEQSLESVFLKSCMEQETHFLEFREHPNLLLYKDFDGMRDRILKYIFDCDESGRPRIFHVKNKGIFSDLLEAASQYTNINLLEIKDLNGDGLINYCMEDPITNLCGPFLEENLTKNSPAFFSQLLEKTTNIEILNQFVNQFETKGGQIDEFYKLWLKVTNKAMPDKNFHERFESLSFEKKQILYESAFVYSNPFVSEPLEAPVKPEQYSINLMWINRVAQPFFMEPKDFQKFLQSVLKWTAKNPESPINLWYDGATTTFTAIEQSQAALQKALGHLYHEKIQFRDVRSIKAVANNPLAFTEALPVYFRSDLLRALAGDHVLSNKESQYFVYADNDMLPISNRELFDKKTMHFLNDYGFVMAKDGALGFENGFQILSDKSDFLKSHRKVLIDLSIEMALERRSQIKEQQIYDTYPAMLAHFLHEDGRYGKLRGSCFSLKKNLKCFRYGQFKIGMAQELPMDKKIHLNDVMPKKPVQLPPSHFG